MAAKTKTPPKIKLMKERGGSTRGLVPAASHGIFDTTYNEYLNTLDPRGNSDNSKAIRLALASSTDRRFRNFLERVGDPINKGKSLAALAKMDEISLVEFQDWRQKAGTQRILAKAQEGVLLMTEDMVEEARSRDVTCDRCDGFGSVVCDSRAPKKTPGFRKIKGLKGADDTYVRQCPSCKGTGKTRAYGSEHARDKLLDMTGLSGRGRSTPAVSITQNFGGASMESAVDRLSRISFDVTEAIEATATEIPQIAAPAESSNSEESIAIPILVDSPLEPEPV